MKIETKNNCLNYMMRIISARKAKATRKERNYYEN